jgi:hypothetical protein
VLVLVSNYSDFQLVVQAADIEVVQLEVVDIVVETGQLVVAVELDIEVVGISY